jgi:xylan 1,4-beta-xylosidase
MKKITLLIVSAILSLFFAFGQNEITQVEGYTNPIIPGVHPDPSVCRVGDDYYLVTSSFEYFPGIPIFHSKDLINWEQIGHCLTRNSQLDLSNTAIWSGVWAPTLRYHKGTFYMITTNVTNGGNFYVSATKPEGPWSDPIWVDNESFDPSLFFDDDGKVYYTRRGKKGIVQSEIDLNTGKLLNPLKMINPGYLSPDTEGPHLYKMKGWYYLLTAEGGTRALHMVNIGRSKSPWGPFEACPKNPILAQHKNYQLIRSTGHADLFEAHDGSWWMVFLATRHYNYDAMSYIGRETFLAPVKWVDGWPVVDADVTNELNVKTKTLPGVPVKNLPVRDEFDQSKLNFCWNFLRNPIEGSWNLAEKPGSLVLHGNKNSLNDIAAPAWVGRRQEDINCTIETKFSFTAEKENEEAGLTIFQNFQHHYEFLVSQRAGSQALVIRKTIGDLTCETITVPLKNQQVYLKIQGDKDKYVFSYSVDGLKYENVGTANPQYLGTEIASSFTGVYFAMYSTGNGSVCTNKASFDYFNYKEIDKHQ